MIVTTSYAHIGNSGIVDARAKVERIVVGNDAYIRPTAEIEIDTGEHDSEEQHNHEIEYYLHIYIVEEGGDPGNTPGSIFLYKSGTNINRVGSKKFSKELYRDKSLQSGCWTGSASASCTVEWTIDDVYDSDSDIAGRTKTLCGAGAQSSIEDDTPEQVKNSLSDAIDEGTDNSALYVDGQILTIDFDPIDTVYIYEVNGIEVVLGNSDLIASLKQGDAVNTTELSFDSAAAPPKPNPKGNLAITWAAMKS